jgi:hypothetical protein
MGLVDLLLLYSVVSVVVFIQKQLMLELILLVKFVKT